MPVEMIDALCDLLEQQKEDFLAYEEATLALLESEPDDAEQYITQRAQLANAIDERTEEMARLCATQPGGDWLLQTALGKTEFGQVPGEYHRVFYAAQAVQSVASRIAQTDSQVLERLGRLRDEALASIRQNQNLPKIKKYLEDLSETPGSLRDSKA